MLAIFKKEMKLYFTTATGYIFLAVALIISGFVLSVNTFMLKEPTSDTSGYFSFILIMMMVFLPVLTMRSFSDERRTKTDQLLFTSPVSVFSLVLGKFLSAFCMFVIYLILSLFNFIPLFAFVAEGASGPNIAMIVGNLIALILVGMLFIAIGIFVSSLTENMFASAVITVASLFSLLLINAITSLPFLQGDGFAYVVRFIVDWLSVFSRFDAFVYGYFDVASLIYYVSLTGIFLFLTERHFQARRLM